MPVKEEIKEEEDDKENAQPPLLLLPLPPWLDSRFFR
jgi:hypothetical protein